MIEIEQKLKLSISFGPFDVLFCLAFFVLFTVFFLLWVSGIPSKEGRNDRERERRTKGADDTVKSRWKGGRKRRSIPINTDF